MRQGEQVPPYIAPDKNPHTIKTEVTGKKFFAELKGRQPQIAWSRGGHVQRRVPEGRADRR